MSTPQQTDLALISRLWPFMRPYTKWLWVVAIATPLGVVGGLIQPILLKQGIDEHIVTGQLDGLGGVALAFMGVVALAFSARALGLYGLQVAGLRALADIRRSVFHHVLGQGSRFFDKRTTGSLMTRTTNDVEAIYESMAFGAVGLVTDALTILGTLGTMLWLDWQLTLVSLSLSPVIVFVVNLFRKKLRALSTIIRASLSNLNGDFAEQINGMTVVQLYGAEERAKETFAKESFTYMDAYRRSNWWDAGLYAIMDGLSALATGLMLWYGASRFGYGDAVSLGLLVAFIDYLGKIFVPIREFSGRIAMIQRAIAALERIFGLLDTSERITTEDTAPLETCTGEIVFDKVAFAYAPEGAPVLRDVSFSITPGEVVALVGSTGSGKTTIGRLLTRMYDGYTGSITLDGHELRAIAPDSVRDLVTVVHQDVYLFDATINENIALWSPEIGEGEVQQAARLSRASDFVESLPQGYDQLIRERGGNLSSGQKQLLGIARAMARPAPVVILDEATASVDAMTEALVDEAVAELFERRTVLVIAHRLSTIIKADRILVLHQGEVVEQGTHEQLMQVDGRYANLVRGGGIAGH
ncbi:MAG: ABC transporter ATP-binding protein [Bradymonadia bacterium]